jgi:predicted kinase
MKEKIPTLTILCGIPRAGKSSWIKKNKKDAVVMSPDEIRKEIFGHQFHAPANPFVFAINGAMASLLLKQGKNVIIDATHITHDLRKSWYPIKKTYKCKTRLVWIYIDEDKFKNLEECKRRNKNSPEGEKLPESALERMALAFEPPDEEDEYLFDEIIEYKNV